jgi:hypothetical protein
VPQVSAPEDDEHVQKQKSGSHIPVDRSGPSLPGRQNSGNFAVCHSELTFLTHNFICLKDSTWYEILGSHSGVAEN